MSDMVHKSKKFKSNDVAEMETEGKLDDVDNFMIEFKRLKQRQPPPDLSDVLEFESEESRQKNHVEKVPLSDPDMSPLCGLKPVKEWNVYTLPQCPGFMFITNPFQGGYHSYWLKRCVCDYPDKPNITNLDPHICTEDIGNLWKYSLQSSGNDITSKDSLIMRLRWVTLGYHYDWDTKKYYADRHTVFPDDLSRLCKYIMSAIGFHQFTSEAAIVNYYHMNSTLAGHTDHSEFDHTAPLISISFGQDAIFLLGGETKATKPLAMFLHSGDICVMSRQSRLCYHAVPRILLADTSRLAVTFDKDVTKFGNTNLQESNKQETFEENEDLQCSGVNSSLLFQYLNSTRINVNVRQVLPPGEEFPAACS